jgi:acetyl-CoA carboxylase carboxyltransferase component
MSVLKSHLKPQSPEFQANRKHHQALASDLKARFEGVRRGGSEQAVGLHRSRGKFLPRERIERLLDPDTPFLELSALAAGGLYDDEVPSAGIVLPSRAARPPFIGCSR